MGSVQPSLFLKK